MGEILMDRIKVDIDGMNFYVVGSDDQEKIQKMAGELTQKIQETAKSNYRLNQVQGLVLTALNLLNDLYQARENLDDLASENPENEKIQKSQEENRALKEEEQRLLEEKKGLQEKVRDLTQKKKDLEGEVRELKGYLDLAKRDLKSAQDQVALFDQKEKAYEDKIYQDQVTIVDLQKEVSLLKGSEEE